WPASVPSGSCRFTNGFPPARSGSGVGVKLLAPVRAVFASIQFAEGPRELMDKACDSDGFAQKRCLELSYCGSPDCTTQSVEFQTPFLGKADSDTLFRAARPF